MFSNQRVSQGRLKAFTQLIGGLLPRNGETWQCGVYRKLGQRFSDPLVTLPMATYPFALAQQGLEPEIKETSETGQ